MVDYIHGYETRLIFDFCYLDRLNQFNLTALSSILPILTLKLNVSLKTGFNVFRCTFVSCFFFLSFSYLVAK